jgi:hypothetical protein
MAERNSYLDLNELIIFASAKLLVTSTWVICMIDKLKSDVLVFSSNPCFHQNKKTANKRAILLKQNQDHIVRTRKAL